MKHPKISLSKLPAICEQLLGGEDPRLIVDDSVEMAGSGVEFDVDRIEDLSAELQAELPAFMASPVSRDLDRFEGRVGGQLHHVLTDELQVDPTTLDSAGLWAYLGVRHFWWFVHWRQAPTFDSGEFSKYRKYIDGTNPAECVLLRSYLRGRMVHRRDAADPYALASSISHGADFWRSHVLRVQTSTAPVLVRQFAQRQTDQRLVTDDLRSYASRLNRAWSNVVLHLYDDDDALRLLDELADE